MESLTVGQTLRSLVVRYLRELPPLPDRHLLYPHSIMPPKDILSQPNKAGFAHMIPSNPTALPQVIAKEACVGEATPVAPVDVIDCLDDKIVC